MSLFRAGFLLLPLFISACSLPTFQKTTHQKPEKTTEQVAPTQQDTQLNTPYTDTQTDQDQTLIDTINDKITFATKQSAELTARSGSASKVPYINKDTLITKQARLDAINTLDNYNIKASTQLANIDTRVEQRKESGLPGDTIQIFISKTDVTLPDATFKTQPIIGQWVRGESRTIRLKDSLLFDSHHSEDLNITYSESYQLLVNNQVISIINPNKSKNQASFDVKTPEDGGSISGSLDYRLVNINQ